MSRREGWTGRLAITVAFACSPSPSWAQSSRSPNSAAEDRDCQRQREAALISGEIVVCAERGDDAEFRIRSRDAARAAYAAATMDHGTRMAPNFAPPPCRPSLLSWCPKLGGAADPVVEVDVAALPPAPPGSDAARFAEPGREGPRA